MTVQDLCKALSYHRSGLKVLSSRTGRMLVENVQRPDNLKRYGNLEIVDFWPIIKLDFGGEGSARATLVCYARDGRPGYTLRRHAESLTDGLASCRYKAETNLKERF